MDYEKFLTPNRSGRDLWNDTRAVNLDFLGARGTDDFLPHADGVVPEDVLNEFVAERADTLLAASRLKSKLESADRSSGAEEVFRRLNLFHGIFHLHRASKRCTYFDCPLVWDTGASFGLTPFEQILLIIWSARSL